MMMNLEQVAEQIPLIRDVKSVADEKVDALDYEQQVDRWNRYNDALDKVQRQCQIQRLRFTRKMSSSYSERNMKNIRAIIAGALFGYAMGIIVLSSITLLEGDKPVNIYLPDTWNQPPWEKISTILSQAIAGAYIAGVGSFMLFWNTGKLPETIKFKTSAFIKYDELYFVQRFIRGMDRVRQDPKIEFPEMTMELPRSWLTQQSLLKIMGSMNTKQ